jgi:DNA alkylation repair enzyme
MTAEDVKDDLNKHASPTDAMFLQRFFKTGPGQYGEGDVFIGVRMPSIRSVCKKYKNLSLTELKKLLDSPVHEHRMVALVTMCEQFKKAVR